MSIVFRFTFYIHMSCPRHEYDRQLLHAASSWVGFGSNLRSRLVKSSLVHMTIQDIPDISERMELTYSRERAGTVWCHINRIIGRQASTEANTVVKKQTYKHAYMTASYAHDRACEQTV